MYNECLTAIYLYTFISPTQDVFSENKKYQPYTYWLLQSFKLSLSDSTSLLAEIKTKKSIVETTQ